MMKKSKDDESDKTEVKMTLINETEEEDNNTNFSSTQTAKQSKNESNILSTTTLG